MNLSRALCVSNIENVDIFNENMIEHFMLRYFTFSREISFEVISLIIEWYLALDKACSMEVPIQKLIEL